MPVHRARQPFGMPRWISSLEAPGASAGASGSGSGILLCFEGSPPEGFLSSPPEFRRAVCVFGYNRACSPASTPPPSQHLGQTLCKPRPLVQIGRAGSMTAWSPASNSGASPPRSCSKVKLGEAARSTAHDAAEAIAQRTAASPPISLGQQPFCCTAPIPMTRPSSCRELRAPRGLAQFAQDRAIRAPDQKILAFCRSNLFL